MPDDPALADHQTIISLPISSSMVATGEAIPGPFISCQDHSGQAYQLQQAHNALVIRSAALEQELSALMAEHERLLADFERLRDYMVLHTPVTVGPDARLTRIPMNEFRVGTWDGQDYQTWSCKCNFHHKQTVGVCAMCDYQRPARPR